LKRAGALEVRVGGMAIVLARDAGKRSAQAAPTAYVVSIENALHKTNLGYRTPWNKETRIVSMMLS